MKAPQVRAARSGDERRVIDTLVLAFSTDPAARWMYPEPERYLRNFSEFVQAFGGRAFDYGTAHLTQDALGAAMWLPPGVHPDDEAVTNLIQRTVPERDQESLFVVFDQMGRYHPDEPHWHLPLIGVDPTRQRNGYGAALLEYLLWLCDDDGTPAYLESSNPVNISLYQRHGFEVLGTIQVGTSPPITPMLRPPLGSMDRRTREMDAVLAG
ncbi:GNAT family N-acetyltransferase [Microvirga massiliensis]|uniref:GNAT family N-acetyltransferase n=1 Tax=Microvirga massiliensis TaxID=1033741 RepID=UPI00062B5573|nr:GNAT family N-acetyltransferase [Microvirga massiliensis]